MSDADPKAVSPSPLETQLDREVATRTRLDAICWMVFGLFTVANAILVDAVVQTQSRATAVKVSLMGFVAAMIWLGLHQRALAHLQMHDTLIHALEIELGIPPKFSATLRNKDLYRRANGVAPFRAQDLIQAGNLLAMLAWFASAMHWGWYVVP